MSKKGSNPPPPDGSVRPDPPPAPPRRRALVLAELADHVEVMRSKSSEGMHGVTFFKKDVYRLYDILGLK